MRKATSTIPIVIAGGADPVAAGLVASFAHMKTAKALGLTVPQSVLLRADHVIQ